MFKPTSLLLVMLGAVGLPYLFSSSSGIRDLAFNATSAPVADVAEPGETAVAPTAPPPHGIPAAQHTPTHGGLLDPGKENATGIEGRRTRSFAEVFRWDLTTAEILANWPRVSTSSVDLELQGYRVVLVTGTNESDIAGSLTYYFNPQQRCQRIEFRGTTGDARPLVSFLASSHKFIREVTQDPALYQYRVYQGRDVLSDLQIKSVGIIRADNPHGRFEVSLVMRRPE